MYKKKNETKKEHQIYTLKITIMINLKHIVVNWAERPQQVVSLLPGLGSQVITTNLL